MNRKLLLALALFILFIPAVSATFYADSIQALGYNITGTGMFVGAASTNNYISTALTGGGSSNLFIGNERILTDGDTLGTAGGWTDSGTTVALSTSSDSVDANTLFINNSNNRVGIGTSTPGGVLDIITPGTSINGLRIFQNNNYYGQVIDAQDYGLGMNIAGNSSASDQRLFTINNNGGNDGNVLRVQNNGNIGIGTSSPGQKLDVEGGNIAIDLTTANNFDRWMGSNVYNAMAFDPNYGTMIASSVDLQFFIDSDATQTGRSFQFRTDGAGNGAGTELVRIEDTGNVGIGTTTPEVPLQVKGGASLTPTIITTSDYVTGTTGTRMLLGFGATTGNTYGTIDVKDVGGGSSADLVILPTSGNVGIGINSIAKKLVVGESTHGTDVAMRLSAENDAGTVRGFDFNFDPDTRDMTMKEAGASTGLTVTETGTIGIGTTNPAETLHVNGGFDQAQVTRYRGYYSTASGVNSTITLNAKDGTTLDWSAMYRIHVAINGDTSTRTGASYLVWDSSAYSGDARNWNIRLIGRAGSDSNHPLAQLNGSTIEVFHNHASTYNIAVVVEKFETDNQNNPNFLGADYHWQRDVSDLYYLDGDVGIGTSTPAAKLDVNGNLTLQNGVAVNEFSTDTSLGGNSDLAVPTEKATKTYVDAQISGSANITGVGSTNHVAYWTDADTLSYDASQLYWDASNNELGIGTTSPGYMLDVQGTVSIGTAAAGGALRIEGKGGSTYPWTLKTTTVSGGLEFSSNSGTTVFFDTDGQVGIGTTSPENYYPGADNLVVYEAGNGGITIASGTSDTGALYFADGTSGDAEYRGGIGYVHAAATERLALISGGSEKISIDTSGNMGIGTTTPTQALHVQGITNITEDLHVDSSSSRPIVVGESGSIRLQGDNGGWAMGTLAKGYAGTDLGGYGFYGGVDALTYYWIGPAYNSPYMVIDNSPAGNVGIGTTTPGAKLEVAGATIIDDTTIDPDSYANKIVLGNIADGGGWSTNGIAFGGGTGQHGAIGATSGMMYFGMQDASTANSLATFMQHAGSTRYTTFPTGNVGIGTASPAYGKLQVYAASGNTLTLQKDSGAAALAFGDTTNQELLIESTSAGGMKIYSGTGTWASPTWTERMAMDTSGNLQMDGDLTISGGDITGAGNVAIDVGEASAAGITITDSDSNYPDINCDGSGGNDLCEFPTGLYVSAATAYFTNQMIARGGIADDTGNLILNDATDVVGTLTADAEIRIDEQSPQIYWKDTDASQDNFWIHVNDNNFYVLADRDENDAWDGTYPLQLEADTDTAYTFGNRILTTADEGTGNGLDADTLDGQHGSYYTDASNLDAGIIPVARQKASFLGEAVQENIVQFNRYDGDEDLDSFTNAGFYGLFGSSHTNYPSSGGSTYDPMLVMRSSSDVGTQLVIPRGGGDTSTMAFRGWSGSGSSWTNWKYVWHDKNDGTGSGLDADTVDTIEGASLLRSDATDAYTSGTLTFNSGTKLAIADNTGIPDASTGSDKVQVLQVGAGGGIYQTSGRGGLMLTSSDDSLVLANGDVGRGFTTQLSAPGEGMYLLSDNVVEIWTDLQEGFGTENKFVFSASGEFTMNGSKFWHAANDGSGSTLDADTLDSIDSLQFLRSDANDQFTGLYQSYNSGAALDLGSTSTDYQGNSGWAGTWNSNMLLSGADYTSISFHDSANAVGTLGYHVNQFFLDGAGSWGPVQFGINQRSPGYTLDVTGDGRFTSDVTVQGTYGDVLIGNSAYGTLEVKGDTSRGSFLTFHEPGTKTWHVGMSDASNVFKIVEDGIAGNVALSIDNDLNAVFGDDLTVTNNFVVNGATATFNPDGDSQIVIQNAGTNAVAMYGAAGDDLYLGGGGTWQMYSSGTAITVKDGVNLAVGTGTLSVGGTFDPNGAITLPTTGITGAGTGSGLDADKLDGQQLSAIVPYHSGSDFVNGTLVVTNIPATATNGDSFVIEISGKSYSSSNPPFKVIAQGYLYNNQIINYDGISYGGNFASYIKIFEDGGYLNFWWPRISYWNSFNVHVRAAGGSPYNRVTSVSNAAEPTGTKKVQLDLEKSWASFNDGTGSTLDADLLDGQNGAYYLDDTTLSEAAVEAMIFDADNTGSMETTGDIRADNFLVDTSTVINDAALTITDANRYVWTPYSGWGEYWDTSTNSIEYWGNGVEVSSLDLDNGNMQIDGDLTITGNSLLDSGGDTFWEGTCADNEHITGISAEGVISCGADSGDISAVNAGTGLVGGGSSGSVTLGITTGTYDNITVRAPFSTGYGSGFYQTSTATTAEGWPETGSWFHLINNQHSNGANNYAMQLSADFYEQDLYFRSTAGSGSTAWNEVWHAGSDGSGSGLDADTVDGTELDNIQYGTYKGTFVSTLSDANNVDRTGVYTGAAITNKPSEPSNWIYLDTMRLYNSNNDYNKQIAHDTYNNNMWVRTENAGTWSSWYEMWNEYSDGAGSGLDADLLDGQNGAYYLDDTTLSEAAVEAMIFDADNTGSMTTTGTLTAATIDTGNGAMEVNSIAAYLGNQNLRSTDAPSFDQLTITAGDGDGLKFWDSDTYKIYMRQDYATEQYAGDYNMYFTMGGGTNRGFVFMTGTTPNFQIDASGNIWANNNAIIDGTITTGSSAITLTNAAGYILEGAIAQNTLDDSELATGGVGADSIASTAVSAGTYGDANNVAQFTVDADGRLTAASNVGITTDEDDDIAVEEDNAAVDESVYRMDFQSGFDVTADGASEVNIALDLSEITVDADTLDTIDSGSFLRSDAADTAGSKITFNTGIARGAHAAGFLEGSYNNVGANSGKSNPIYTIGSSYNPGDATIGNMYGIGYSHDNWWYDILGEGESDAGWGMYVASDGNVRVTLSGENGDIWSARNIHADGAFEGAGTGLTGTAASLSIGGNAATATALASNPTDCGAGQAPQTIDASGNFGGCTTYLQSEVDGDASNEIQTLGTSGSTITLSNGGGSVTAPYATNAGTLDSIDSTQFFRNDYLSTRSIADANTADGTGVTGYYLTSGASNKPTGTDHSMLTMSYSNLWSTQMAADWRTNNWYVREQNSGTWGAWDTIWTSGNDGASSTLDADKLDAQEGSYYLNAGNINAGTLAVARGGTGTTTSTGTGSVVLSSSPTLTTPTAAYYRVTAGAGNGICFWVDCTNYKIHMGDAAENHYGPVTGYSIKTNMNNQAGRGWTWGVTGATPVAAIEATTGDTQIAGDLTVAGNDIEDSGGTARMTFSSGNIVLTVG